PGIGFLPAAAVPIGSYYFALFAAPSSQNTISTVSDPTANGWTYVALGTNTSAAGRMDGNNASSYPAVNIPGFAAGTTADFAVAGWSSSVGTTWAQAQAWWRNGNPGNTIPGWFGINPDVANDIPVTDLNGPPL